MSSRTVIEDIGKQVIPVEHHDRFNQLLIKNDLSCAVKMAQKWMPDAVKNGRIKEEEQASLLVTLDNAQSIAA